MKRIIVSYIFISLGILSFGQGVYDALRLSETDVLGTARYAGMSGAFGALGGDFTTLSDNPAGIGVFRSSEISFTPQFYMNSSESDFNGVSNNDSKLGLGLSSIGYVGTIPLLKETGLASINIGFGFNQLKNFNRNQYVGTNNYGTSMTDIFARQATNSGIGWEDLSNSFGMVPDQTILAWESYLIDYRDGTGVYQSPLFGADGDLLPSTVDIQKSINEKGSLNEWVFSIGGNYGHKFYFGATLGIQDVDYKHTSLYQESFNPSVGNYSYFRYVPGTTDQVNFEGGGFSYYDTYHTTGVGYNLKIGAIARPIKNLRLGFAFHTPTYYALSDAFSKEIIPSSVYYLNGANGSYTNSLAPSSKTDESISEYSISTPAKLLLSAAYTISKRGLVSVEYNYTDYSQMRIMSSDGSEADFLMDNRIIENNYGAGHTFKVGTEIRLNPNYFTRLGARFITSPREEIINDPSVLDEPLAIDVNSNYTSFSAGLGYRTQDFFADIAYVYGTQELEHNVMGSNFDGASILSTNTITNSNFVFTLGFKF